jgi:uncharacterized membrane protein YqjE
MDSDVPFGSSPSVSDAADSVRRWIASLVLYVELRIRLFALESKDAGFHLLVLAVLLVSAFVLFAGFLAMLIVFLLYLLTLIFHWEWGWSALACAGVLLIISIIVGAIFRFRIIKPLYPSTVAEFKKDCEWLSRQTKNTDRDGAIRYQSRIEYPLFARAAKSGYSSISIGVPKEDLRNWVTVAAIIGWLLSRLPARKQKIYIGSSDRLKSEKRRGGGGLLRPLWNGGWAITKPLLAAYLTKKITEKTKYRDGNSQSQMLSDGRLHF